MHDEFFAVGVDAVETATFGAFPLVLNEYGIADETFEINGRAAELAKEVAAELLDPRPAPVRDRLDRARAPGSRRSARSRFAELRDDYEVQVDGLLAGGVDVLLIETVQDLLQGKAAINGARRAMATAGVAVPIMVQVTVETTGPHARRLRDRRRAHRARSDAARRDRHELRDRSGRDDRAPALPRAARAHVPLVPAQRGPAVGRRRPHALRPHARRRSPTRTSASSTEFGLNIVGGCCGTTPEHLRAVVERLGDDARPSLRTPEYEPGCSSIYTHVPFHQELAYLAVGERTNANGSRKFRDAMLEADWDTCVQMAREQVKEGAHVLDVCVDYVGRDGTVDMDEIAGRFATQAALPLVFDSTEPQVLEAGLQHSRRQGDPQLGQPRRGRGRGQALRPRVVAGARVRRRGHLPRDRRRGPGAHRRLEAAGRQAHLRPRDRALRHRADRPDLRRAHVPARRPATRTSAATGSRRSRRSAASRPSCPGASTILGLSNVSLRAQARGPPRAQQRVPARVPRGRPRRRDRARGAHHADAPDRRRASARSRSTSIYDRRRDDYDPLTEFMALFEGVEAGAVEKEDRSGWPVEERLKHRIIDGDRDGLEADLDEQLAVAARARDRQRRAARRA